MDPTDQMAIEVNETIRMQPADEEIRMKTVSADERERDVSSVRSVWTLCMELRASCRACR